MSVDLDGGLVELTHGDCRNYSLASPQVFWVRYSPMPRLYSVLVTMIYTQVDTYDYQNTTSSSSRC